MPWKSADSPAENSISKDIFAKKCHTLSHVIINAQSGLFSGSPSFSPRILRDNTDAKQSMGFTTSCHFMEDYCTILYRIDMIKLLHIFYSISLYLSPFNPILGQGISPVNWHFKADSISKHEIILRITARLSPNWHIYSQYLNDGGPQPSVFTFEQSKDYTLLGNTKEKGNQIKVYDETYEMEIVWYSGQVSFLQRIHLNQPVTTIKGTIEYMTCNNELCFPGKKAFAFDVTLLKKM